MSKEELTGFPEKWLKKLPTGFADEADALSEEELKKLIIRSENNINTIEKEKDADPKLNGAKEITKSLTGPYREATSAQKAKIKYALYLLENKGIDLEK